MIEREKNFNLQMARFVAAALVVHAHAVDLTQQLGARPPVLASGGLENFGAVGVDIFFVISGFIITRTAARATSAIAFGWSRLWRVAPLYYLASLPWIAIHVADGRLTPQALVATFAFWPAAGAEPIAPVLYVGWTLCFEMLFYGVVALLIAGGRKRTGLMIALLGYGTCWLARAWTDLAAFQILGNPMILEFLMGAAAASLAPRLGRRVGALILALGLAGFMAGIGSGVGRISELKDVLAGGAVAAWRVLVWGVPSLLVVLGAVVLEPSGPPGVVRRALARLGDASYVLYLIHPLVLFVAYAFFRSTPDLAGDLIILAALIACSGLALVVHRWIEQPLLALRPNLGSDKVVSCIRTA